MTPRVKRSRSPPQDALDRGGVQANTAVSVEVSAKPFELVFDRILAGGRRGHLDEPEAVRKGDDAHLEARGGINVDEVFCASSSPG